MLLDEHSAILPERADVAPVEVRQRRPARVVIGQADDERGPVADEVAATGRLDRQLAERGKVVLALRLRHREIEADACLAGRACLLDPLEDVLDRDRGVPDLEGAHRGVRADPAAILATDRPGDVAAGVLGIAVLARRDDDARREPLEVPFPRTAIRLVEVVEVEHETPFRAGIDPEIGEMRVTAQLRHRADRRRRGKVRGHDRCRAPEQREGRGQHASHPDRNERRQPTLVRGRQRRDRIGPICARCPDPVAAAGHLPASRASALEGERGATVGGQRLGRVEHR